MNAIDDKRWSVTRNIAHGIGISVVGVAAVVGSSELLGVSILLPGLAYVFGGRTKIVFVVDSITVEERQ